MASSSVEQIHLNKTFLVSLGGTLTWTAMMVYQIQVVGLSPLELVLLGTVMELSIFVFEVPTGVVADMVSRRLSAIVGYLLLGLGFIVQALFPSFAVLLIGNIVWGLGYTFTSGAYEAWLVDEIGQERAGQAMLRGDQAARVAAILGIIGAMGLGSLSLPFTILSGGLLTLLAGFYLWWKMPETGFAPTPAQDRSTWQQFMATLLAGLRLIRQRPKLLNIVGIGFIFGLFSEAFDRLWQAHLIQNVGIPFAGVAPIVVIGALGLLLNGLGVGLSAWMQRRLRADDGPQVARFFLIATLLMVTMEALFALATGQFLLAVLAYITFTLARDQAGIFYSVWSNQHIESQVRATVLSMQSQTDAIGQMAGGPPLGALGLRSIPLALLTSSAILALALPLIWRGSQGEMQSTTTS